MPAPRHAALPRGARLGTAFTVVGWTETQLTARQRRMDRALTVRLATGPHLIHYEWELAWDAGIAFRAFEYHVMHVLAAHSQHQGEGPPPTMESHVVVLSGPDAPLPAAGAYRTTAAHDHFGGVPFTIDPVYQRTIAELRERGPLWLVFAPLARDATPDAMPRVVDEIRRQVPGRRHFQELAVAAMVLADADRRERRLRPFLEACLPREVVVKSWVYQQGLQEGEQKGLKKGVRKGREQGLRWMRDALYATLDARKIRLTAARRKQIESETHPETLLRWHQRALTAKRPADVLGPRPTS